jgi:hypothetical protein
MFSKSLIAENPQISGVAARVGADVGPPLVAAGVFVRVGFAVAVLTGDGSLVEDAPSITVPQTVATAKNSATLRDPAGAATDSISYRTQDVRAQGGAVVLGNPDDDWGPPVLSPFPFSARVFH